MKASQDCINIIRRFEGFRPQKYLCPAGKPTIGYGHVILDTDNLPAFITEFQAIELLKKDLEVAEKQIQGFDITQFQFDALASFLFNTGTLQGAMLEHLRHKEPHRCVGEFGRWVYTNGKPLPGLIKRRAAEALLFINHKE